MKLKGGFVLCFTAHRPPWSFRAKLLCAKGSTIARKQRTGQERTGGKQSIWALAWALNTCLAWVTLLASQHSSRVHRNTQAPRPHQSTIPREAAKKEDHIREVHPSRPRDSEPYISTCPDMDLECDIWVSLWSQYNIPSMSNCFLWSNGWVGFGVTTALSGEVVDSGSTMCLAWTRARHKSNNTALKVIFRLVSSFCMSTCYILLC